MLALISVALAVVACGSSSRTTEQAPPLAQLDPAGYPVECQPSSDLCWQLGLRVDLLRRGRVTTTAQNVCSGLGASTGGGKPYYWQIIGDAAPPVQDSPTANTYVCGPAGVFLSY
jgi:hypothetical protein